VPDNDTFDQKVARLAETVRYLSARMDEIEARHRERARPRDHSEVFWRRTPLRSPPRRLH
jgi:hypothetical protein